MIKVSQILCALAFVSLTVYAQSDENKPADMTGMFEGELHYRSVENHDKFVVEASCGLAYNGARNVTYIIKGNKMLLIDECTHMRTLIDVDKNEVILYSDLINKGMQFNYESYAKSYLGSFAEEGPTHGYRPSLYRFEDEGQVTHNGKPLDYIKGRIENKTASTDFEFYTDRNIAMPVFFSKTFTYGIGIRGLITRMKYVQNNQININLGGVGKLIATKTISQLTGGDITEIKEAKSFVLSELKEVRERLVDDAELTVPAGVKISKSKSPFKVLDIYKQNHAYLVQNNMYPTQLNKDVLYAIDEEWDY